MEYLPEYAIVFIYALVAVFGLCVGSFINVVISRLPIKGAFLSSNRSQCPGCGETLSPIELVPVLSWIMLLGRCKHCKRRISPRYPIVELLGALFATTCLWFFEISHLTPVIYVTLMILLAITIIDFNTSEIPDSLIIALIFPTAAAFFLFTDVTPLSHVIGLFAIALPMLLLTLLIPGAFGGGDIKLIAVCGLMLGWQLILTAFFIAIVFAGSIAIYLMISGRKKRGQHMVFGPALCAGVAISIFYGHQLIDWYLSLFFY
ncbi:MAG: prepilin peptidase [Oscillospiraceae bacterium]|jgi:leader peptidase (prepilin peptidase)/N-methyltransferase|nr:prepilin peptidase [Oscillospiraceae bacterium]